MGKYVDFKSALEKLLHSCVIGDQKQIEEDQYKLLWEASNFYELISNFIFLDKIGINLDFGSSIIKRGTQLYRIRSYNEQTDYDDPNEWSPPPSRPQNRANRKGNEALYLGSTENVCLLETHVAYNYKYVIGTYECQEDIIVGGFPSYDMNNNLRTLAAIILNAFLIAPARGEKNDEMFEYLDSYFCNITLDNLCDIKQNVLNATEELKLPYKFAVLFQTNMLYYYTNQICEIIEKRYSDGIRYSSCYMPVETPGIVCSDYNIALYTPGIAKLKKVSHSVKTHINTSNTPKNGVNIAKILLEGRNANMT